MGKSTAYSTPKTERMIRFLSSSRWPRSGKKRTSCVDKDMAVSAVASPSTSGQGASEYALAIAVCP